MLSAFIKFGDGRISTDTDPAVLAAAVRDPGATFWLDMDKPTDEDYSLLDDVFGFHPLAIEDTIKYQQRPKIESYNHVGDACRQGYFYMVIHGPDLESFRENLRTKELDIFVSERYLVTVHDEPLKSVTDLLARSRIDPRVVLEPGIDLVLHNILDHMVDNYQPILDYMQEALNELEEEAVSNPTSDLLTRIGQKKRELLNFRRIIGPQREVVAQLTRGEVPFIRESTRVYMRDVQDHLVRAVEMIELYRDLVTGARDIYMSTVSNRLNQIMKTLTIITVVAMPMTVVTSFFGQNFSEKVWPFDAVLNSHAGFWIAMGLMVTASTGLLIFFHRRKWL